jgi:hypothetical protein
MHISQKLWVRVVIAHVVRLFWTGTLTTYYQRPIKGSCSELFKLAKQCIMESQIAFQSLEEFCSFLSNILWRFAMLQDPWRWSQNGPAPPPKPLQQPWYICQHVATVHLSQATNTFSDTCFSLSLILDSSVGWISTLTYETSTNCWPERFSVVYCTHIFQIKLMLKNRRYPQKSMFTATELPPDVPLMVLGYSVWVVGK